MSDPSPSNCSGGDSPLVIEIRDSKLVIEIGITTLAFAQHARESFEERVIDEEEFAKEVILRMEYEHHESGSNICKFIDRMCDEVVENGSLATAHSYVGML